MFVKIFDINLDEKTGIVKCPVVNCNDCPIYNRNISKTNKKNIIDYYNIDEDHVRYLSCTHKFIAIYELSMKKIKIINAILDKC